MWTRQRRIAQQREYLIKQSNSLLGKATEEAYQQLYDMYINKIYEVTIQKTTELSILREMLECRQREQEIGNPCIFNDVCDLQQAELKYLKVKHGLWRIENSLSYEKCKDAVEKLRHGDFSLFFIAWVVYSNLREKEKTYVELASFFAEESIVEAIELLSYGLLFLKNSSELLIQQANYFMELNLWNEALNALKQIENPSDEISSVIEELSGALSGING